MSNHNHPINVSVVDSADKASEVDVKVVETPNDETVEQPLPDAPNTETVESDEDDALAALRPSNPIKLSHPIRINGTTRDTFTWTDEISTDQFLQADSFAHTGRVSVNVAELDSGFNLALGRMMIVAANHEVDYKDLDQIRGLDIMKVMKLGRFFTNQSED